MEEKELKVGRITKVVRQKHYAFIKTDAGEDYFYHLHNARSEKCPACGSTVAIMPAENSLVRFRVLHLHEPGKMDRAIDVEVMA
jgi:hypothetical protein